TPLDLAVIDTSTKFSKEASELAADIKRLHQQVDLPGEYGVSATFNVVDLQPYFDPEEPLQSLRTNSCDEGEQARICRGPFTIVEQGIQNQRDGLEGEDVSHTEEEPAGVTDHSDPAHIGLKVEVKVFSLSSCAWRRPSINLPRENMTLETPQVVIDEFIYHLAFDYSKKGYVSNMIISFDLTSEEFREIHPESIKLGKLSISKLRETLVVLEYNMGVASGMPLCAVWMMDNDSFTQLYTIKAPAPSFNAILGFRKTRAIIFKRRVYNDNKSLLATYELDSKQITEIGVFDSECSFSVHSYKETQLLIDQPDGTIY
nr:hypothetical protein [Tanacetum cinerariifolium]